MRTYLGACRTHERGGQGIEPRVLGFEFQRTNHCRSYTPRSLWHGQSSVSVLRTAGRVPGSILAGPRGAALLFVFLVWNRKWTECLVRRWGQNACRTPALLARARNRSFRQLKIEERCIGGVFQDCLGKIKRSINYVSLRFVTTDKHTHEQTPHALKVSKLYYAFCPWGL